MKMTHLCCALIAAAACFSATSAEVIAAADPLTKMQVDAIVAAPGRSADDLKNDQRRKPAEILGFIGVRPGMQALDVVAGGGYTTELLARAVGPAGHVYAQSPPASGAAAASVPASGAPTSRSAVAVTKRAQAASLGNITTVVQPIDSPTPSAVASGGLDLVTLMFNYHDLEWLKVDRMKMNRAIFAGLKPGGMYIVADHAGRAGTGVSESNTLHRIEEDVVKKEVTAAGFKLAAEGTFLRNPADPRDHETPENDQPKDEFVLKFVKP